MEAEVVESGIKRSRSEGDGSRLKGEREVVERLEKRNQRVFAETLPVMSHWGLTNCDLNRPVRTLLSEDNGNDGMLALPNLSPNMFKNDISCPICLEPYNKTWTVMSCLHRFCSECFHRSLRMELGSTASKECPLCRSKLASRRDSRPDEAFDCIVRMLSNACSSVDEGDRVVYTPVHSPRSSRVQVQEAIANFDADYYRKAHAENVAKFRQRQIQQKRMVPSGNAVLPGERFVSLKRRADGSTTPGKLGLQRANSSGAATHSELNYQHFALKSLMVAFALFPKPSEELAPLENKTAEVKPLLKPFFRTNVMVTVRELKILLQQKNVGLKDYPLSEIEISINFHNEVVPLQDSYTLRDICINFWDRKSKFIIYYCCKV